MSRNPAPEIDREYLESQLGSSYEFVSVWNEREGRWFVALVEIELSDTTNA